MCNLYFFDSNFVSEKRSFNVGKKEISIKKDACKLLQERDFKQKVTKRHYLNEQFSE